MSLSVYKYACVCACVCVCMCVCVCVYGCVIYVYMRLCAVGMSAGLMAAAVSNPIGKISQKYPL